MVRNSGATSKIASPAERRWIHRVMHWMELDGHEIELVYALFDFPVDGLLTKLEPNADDPEYPTRIMLCKPRDAVMLPDVILNVRQRQDDGSHALVAVHASHEGITVNASGLRVLGMPDATVHIDRRSLRNPRSVRYCRSHGHYCGRQYPAKTAPNAYWVWCTS